MTVPVKRSPVYTSSGVCNRQRTYWGEGGNDDTLLLHVPGTNESAADEEQWTTTPQHYERGRVWQ